MLRDGLRVLAAVLPFGLVGPVAAQELPVAESSAAALQTAFPAVPRCSPSEYLEQGLQLARSGRAQEALPPIFRAAIAGNAYAQHNLALFLFTGAGVARDQELAAEWWLKAAEQGLPQAQYNLGLCYAKGLGVKASPRHAALWWYRAAKLGMADAAYNLALCYREGFGVSRDELKAQAYFRLAGAEPPPAARSPRQQAAERRAARREAARRQQKSGVKDQV